ncbi:MAG: ABC transporter ATP-binding protein/permease, partial [Gemmatimonadaceae bacterium]|nr:ABC transporter ATP-binding protein/permease [Gemmatimonadaceae bacterium]
VLHSRVVSDSERIDTTVTSLIAGVAPAVLSGAMLLVVLSWLDWRLLLLAAVLTPLLWLGGRATSRRVRDELAGFRAAFERYSTGASFVLRQADLIRYAVAEDAELERQADAHASLRDRGTRMAMSFAVHGQVQRLLVAVAALTVFVVGGIRVAEGELSIGAFLAFWLAAGMMHAAIESISSGVPDLLAASNSLAALRELATGAPPGARTGTTVHTLAGVLGVRDVHFSYGERPILRGVTLEVARGSVVAVSGANGAGKSTLLHLLTGLYRPDRGVVHADGHDYATLDVRHVRRQIGVVPQHPQLFTGTLRENVAFGVPHATDADVRAALVRVGGDALLARLPEGLATRVGERGARLSGGEAQRVAMARALLGHPRVLILDEPSTHLDAGSIESLVATVRALSPQPTVVLVSHDAAVTALADTVYTLVDGQLEGEPHRTPRHAA